MEQGVTWNCAEPSEGVGLFCLAVSTSGSDDRCSTITSAWLCKNPSWFPMGVGFADLLPVSNPFQSGTFRAHSA
jgi:hypothetical protein